MIKGFIELTDNANGKRVAIAIDSIRAISEGDDGDFRGTLIRFKGLAGQPMTNFPTGFSSYLSRMMSSGRKSWRPAVTEFIELTDTSGDKLALKASAITAFNAVHNREGKTWSHIWAGTSSWDVSETYAEIKAKMLSLGL